MWGDSLVLNNFSHRVDADVTFYIGLYRFPNLISGDVLRETLTTLCFVLTDDLHINILKFVVGHGAVIQPASIYIAFGYKQAQQYSRIHQLRFTRTVSWSEQNAELRTNHSYSRTLQLSCIL